MMIELTPSNLLIAAGIMVLMAIVFVFSIRKELR